MLRISFLLAFSSLMVSCGPDHYPLNIEPDANATINLTSVHRRVLSSLPHGEANEETRQAQALLALLEPGAAAASQGEQALIDAHLQALEEGEVLAFTIETEVNQETAFQEVSAGLLFHPFDELQAAMEPGTHWGRYLDDYLGGTYEVDGKDRQGRPMLARERMVLGTPAWAVGAGEMDMSKVELTSYSPDQILVDWEVTASGNGSVHLDVGYVAFRRYQLEEEEVTLVLFNSIHRTEAGWFGDMLSDGARADITRDVLSTIFASHIENYREVARDLLEK